jgi:hypothetical protein
VVEEGRTGGRISPYPRAAQQPSEIGGVALDRGAGRASNSETHRVRTEDVVMRKLVLAVCGLLFAGGLVSGVEVTLVKFDKDTKEVTVKEGGEEKVYKITAATKFSSVDKTGAPRALTYDDVLKGLTNAKAAGKLKFDVTAKDGTILEAKMPGKKK